MGIYIYIDLLQVFGYIYIDLLQVFLADLILFQIGFMFCFVPTGSKTKKKWGPFSSRKASMARSKLAGDIFYSEIL